MKTSRHIRIRIRKPESELFYPIKPKVMTDEETRAYHRKKLYELSLKSLGRIPQLDDPTDEQKEWVKRRMVGSASSWEAFNP